ncbi:MAG: porin [Pseudoxanthomonas suwonensis]|nr:porin [Pseudoxanthomonas suwonensis]
MPSAFARMLAARRRHFACHRLALVLVLAAASNSTFAQDDWKLGGDVRMGYVASDTRTRNGAESSADSFRARVRVNLRGELAPGWRAGGRLATRLDSRQDGMRFWRKPNAPTATGLEDGQATIDEAWLEYQATDSPFSVRVGRFQAAFAPADLMKKSLDQNDSPNFDVTWTDGVWLQWRGSRWTSHAIVRYNDRDGSGTTLRAPLGFDDSRSRAGLFLATESREPVGPVVQRMLTLSWLPSALHPSGLADATVKDYIAFTAKGAAEWPLGEGARKLRLGGEIGWAPETPRREAMKSGTGEADALSWQTSLSIMDIVPRHDVGIVYGRVADGWLLSNDFRPNNSLIEARWVWRPLPAWQFDARMRRREEIDLPDGTTHARRDNDIYVRATRRF